MKYMSAPMLALKLGVSRRTVVNWCQRLKVKRCGKVYAITPAVEKRLTFEIANAKPGPKPRV